MRVFVKDKTRLISGTTVKSWVLFPDASLRILYMEGSIGIYKGDKNVSIPLLRLYWGLTR